MIARLSLAAVVAVAAGTAGAQNRVMNAGFEDQIAFNFPDGLPTAGNWTAFFGSGSVTANFADDVSDAPQAFEGDSALILGGLPPSSFNGVLQDVAVTAGETIEFGLWARAEDVASDNLEFRVEFRDSDRNAVDTDGDGVVEDDFGSSAEDLLFTNTVLTSLVTGEYQLFSVTAVVPENATIATFVIATNSFDGGASGAFFNVDNAFLVPAPGALAALGFAGLAGARRRR